MPKEDDKRPKEGDRRRCERCERNGEVGVLQEFKLQYPVGSYLAAGGQLPRNPKPQDVWVCKRGHNSPD